LSFATAADCASIKCLSLIFVAKFVSNDSTEGNKEHSSDGTYPPPAAETAAVAAAPTDDAAAL
jgi:hypothetical protein